MMRRIAAILATTGVLAVGFLPSASAQDPTPSAYGAGAQATAMQLSLAGQFEAAFSVTGASVAGEPATAKANGAAALITGVSEDLTTAQTPGNPATAEDCVIDEELPTPINLAGLALACVKMATDGAPSGTSASEELGLSITAPDGLDTVVDQALTPVLEQVLAGLDPVLAELGLTPTVTTLVDTVLANVRGGSTLAELSVAPTSSNAAKVSGRGEARGVVVSLLPDLQLLSGEVFVPVGPLATITLGDAFAQAVFDAATGEVVTDGKAALISVDLAGLQALVDALVVQVEGILEALLPATVTEPLIGTILAPVVEGVQTLIQALDTEIEANVNVTVDQLGCTDENPLAPLICFVAGGVRQLDAEAAKALGYDYGPTTKGIQAQVLDLALLSALGENPLLALSIGGASAAAASVPVSLQRSDPPVTPAQSLPRTGTDAQLPVALGLLAVAGLGAAALRRARTV